MRKKTLFDETPVEENDNVKIANRLLESRKIGRADYDIFIMNLNNGNTKEVEETLEYWASM